MYCVSVYVCRCYVCVVMWLHVLLNIELLMNVIFVLMCFEASYTSMYSLSLSFFLIYSFFSLPFIPPPFLLFIIVNVTLTPNGSVVVDYLSNITFTCSFETDEDPTAFNLIWFPLDRDLNILPNVPNGTTSMLILSGVTLFDSINYTCAVLRIGDINHFDYVSVLLTVKRKLHVLVMSSLSPSLSFSLSLSPSLPPSLSFSSQKMRKEESAKHFCISPMQHLLPVTLL